MDVFWHPLGKGYRLNITNLIQQNVDAQQHEAFALDVIKGFSQQPKAISAKYFYDDVGSELFQQISQHADYYLTKTEFSILASIQHQLPELIDTETIDIIELGAGDGHKSKRIIDGFLSHGTKVNFYPIDISEKAMHLMGDYLQVSDDLHIHGIVADYIHGLHHIHRISNNKKLVLFLGSNIGNFTKAQSLEFLAQLHASLDAEDYLLIGFDLIKDPATLNKAYNDSDGLTTAFNLNLLDRINRELGGNIDTQQFKHYGFYNPTLTCMESYLIAKAEQDIKLDVSDQAFHFDAFEPLHLEYSYKYSPAEITHLANRLHFSTHTLFSDHQQYFIDALWQVRK